MLVLFTESDYTVASAAIVSTCVLLHQITNIDDEPILNHGDRNPVLRGRIPNLQAFGVRLLQKDGNGAEIGVRGDYMTG